MERVTAGRKSQSEIMLSQLPSKSSPTSRPLASRVADPELPPVVSTSDRKSTGSEPTSLDS